MKTKTGPQLEKTDVPKQMSQKYKPITQPFGSKTKYKISLKMDSKGHFDVGSRSTITNTSNEKWSDVVFYFIPNIFTKENSPSLNNPGTANIKRILINGKKAKFSLKKDTLKVLLNKKVYPTKKMVIDIQYNFTMPEEGYRFTKENGNYYLAQWYPMVATYKSGGWNKEDYRVRGETYHTAFSDFEVNYKIPKGLTIVSTSDREYVGSHKTTLKMKNVKDFFIAILNKPNEIERKVGQVNIRTFTLNDDFEIQREALQIAEKALNYFQDKIGPYPHKQLDIIVSQLGMEYPGIVTAGTIQNSGDMSDWKESIVVHEIAHQWFYGMISSDPFHDAWLDEGITNFATNLFYSDYKKRHISLDVSQFNNAPLPVNLPLNEYTLTEQSNYIYGKASVYLWKVLSENGGKKIAEDFLKSYYDLYKYKDVDTAEFVRFIKYYLELKDDHLLKEFLKF